MYIKINLLEATSKETNYAFSFALFCFLLSHGRAQTGLKLSEQSRLALNSSPSCPSPQGAGIKGMHHHTQLK